MSSWDVRQGWQRTAKSRAELILLELGLVGRQRLFGCREPRVDDIGVSGFISQELPAGPWNCDVPDLVTTLMTPPSAPPNDASSSCV